MDPAQTQRIHELFRLISAQPLSAEQPQVWLRSTLEFEPKLFLPAVANPQLLDFPERLMGPFVQMDNLTFIAFSSMTKEEAEGRASGWHRDIWAFHPTHNEYVPPLAANAITYLQDMSDEYGPLRVIPGSHRRPVKIAEDARDKPHPEEILVPVKAGDAVFTHSALLHSGTPNTSGNPRYFSVSTTASPGLNAETITMVRLCKPLSRRLERIMIDD